MLASLANVVLRCSPIRQACQLRVVVAAQQPSTRHLGGVIGRSAGAVVHDEPRELCVEGVGEERHKEVKFTCRTARRFRPLEAA